MFFDQTRATGVKLKTEREPTTGVKLKQKGDPTAGVKLKQKGDPRTGVKLKTEREPTTGVKLKQKGDPTTGVKLKEKGDPAVSPSSRRASGASAAPGRDQIRDPHLGWLKCLIFHHLHVGCQWSSGGATCLTLLV